MTQSARLNAADALSRLKEGNARFVSNLESRIDQIQNKHTALALEQNPFAIILGCSDARVPAEIVFDQGLGDLFVIRVAGNIVAPSQIGSIEYAVEQFGTPLVVVMGHSRCGAIEATVNELTSSEASRSPNLRSIVDRISPSVETLLETPIKNNPEELVHYAVRANVRSSVGHLRQGSRIIEQLIGRGELAIVGAQYFIETGKVEFFSE